jgi:Glycogen debranching enzyme N terminal/Amylo-alpha-1,6-glucosidase
MVGNDTAAAAGHAGPAGPTTTAPASSTMPRAPLVCVVEHGRDVLGEDAQATACEFLLTNGVGGYASASLAGALTRSYHGLLVAALKPPLDRTLLLSAVDDAALYLGRAYILTPHPFVHNIHTTRPRLLSSTSSPSPFPARMHPVKDDDDHLRADGTAMPAAEGAAHTKQDTGDGHDRHHHLEDAATETRRSVLASPPQSLSPMIRVRNKTRSSSRPGRGLSSNAGNNDDNNNHNYTTSSPEEDAVLASPGVLREMHARQALGGGSAHWSSRHGSIGGALDSALSPCITTASSLESFRLEGTMPVFTYALADALLEKRIWLKRSENAVFIRYNLVRATRPLALSLDAMVNHRNHHSRTLQSRPGFSHSTCSPAERTVVIDFNSTDAGGRSASAKSPTRLVLRSTRGRADIANAWVHGGDLHRERERGLPCVDDHLHAASFTVDLVPGGSVTIVAAAYEGKGEPGERMPGFLVDMDIDEEMALYRRWESGLLDRFHASREQHLRRRAEIAESRLRRLSAKSQSLLVRRRTETPPDHSPVEILRASVEPAILQLVLAADQFVIERGIGKSIIAGYHWFADWSRDTMIALPGLTICTGRLDVARAILVTFAKYISRGMVGTRALNNPWHILDRIRASPVDFCSKYQSCIVV